MADIESLWRHKQISHQTYKFYIKFIKSTIRILFILFICRYFLFLPKTHSFIKT